MLTGKGNIKDSRQNAIEISEFVASSYLGVAESDATPPLIVPLIPEATIAAAIEPSRYASAETRGRIKDWVEDRWRLAEYPGSYPGWMARYR